VSGRKNDRRRGATIVEFALAFLPVFALLLAILDFGFAIFLKSTLQHAVREGVRYAVTGRTESGTGHDDSIKGVVQRHAMGQLSGADGASKIIIRYYNPNTLAEVTGAGSNVGGNIVEISIEGFTWGWIAPVLRQALPALTLRARSSDRMEPSPGGTPPPR
jgi:hypothetical protein